MPFFIRRSIGDSRTPINGTLTVRTPLACSAPEAPTCPRRCPAARDEPGSCPRTATGASSGRPDAASPSCCSRWSRPGRTLDADTKLWTALPGFATGRERRRPGRRPADERLTGERCGRPRRRKPHRTGGVARSRRLLPPGRRPTQAKRSAARRTPEIALRAAAHRFLENASKAPAPVGRSRDRCNAGLRKMSTEGPVRRRTAVRRRRREWPRRGRDATIPVREFGLGGNARRRRVFPLTCRQSCHVVSLLFASLSPVTVNRYESAHDHC